MNSTTLTRFKANGNDSSYCIKYCKIHLILYMWVPEFFFRESLNLLHLCNIEFCARVILNCILILLSFTLLIYCLLFTITFFLIFPLLLDIFIYIFLLKHVLKKKKKQVENALKISFC